MSYQQSSSHKLTWNSSVNDDLKEPQLRARTSPPPWQVLIQSEYSPITSVLDLNPALYAVDSVGKSIGSNYQYIMSNAIAGTKERHLTSTSVQLGLSTRSRQWSVAMKSRTSRQVRSTVSAIGLQGVNRPSRIDIISYPCWALGPSFLHSHQISLQESDLASA